MEVVVQCEVRAEIVRGEEKVQAGGGDEAGLHIDEWVE